MITPAVLLPTEHEHKHEGIAASPELEPQLVLPHRHLELELLAATLLASLGWLFTDEPDACPTALTCPPELRSAEELDGWLQQTIGANRITQVAVSCTELAEPEAVAQVVIPHLIGAGCCVALWFERGSLLSVVGFEQSATAEETGTDSLVLAGSPEPIVSIGKAVERHGSVTHMFRFARIEQ
eukprot:TRINITY_DN27668_c0_g1_i3.p1 TRINITY_DN27668_c0_g1~~TRINITY_DN27668_c0_g1_i3.p1  ORF type:complete len:183 (+),score=32.49 TRINITY_DN27668_c0_g1_i3:258-806(+)